MRTRLITTIAAIYTLMTTAPVKADTVSINDTKALAEPFCSAVADSPASLIPAFDRQYNYFGGLMSSEHTLTAKQMAIVSSYAVIQICPQLKPAAAAKVQSFYNWLGQQNLNQAHPDVKSEMLTIGAAIEMLPF